MTFDEFMAEFLEAPDAGGFIGKDFWESVFEEIDDPDGLRSYLRTMEYSGSADITWNADGIPEEVWLRGY